MMVEHAEEFLGCWFTVRNQYQPLIQGFAALVMRADQVIARLRNTGEAARVAKADDKPATTIDNSTKESK